MRKRKASSNQLIVINDQTRPEIINYIPSSPSVKQKSSFLRSVSNNSQKSSLTIPILIDTIQDKDDPSIIYPIQQETIIPEQYFCFYKSTRNILFNKENNMSSIDVYMFLYICDNFAHEASFFVQASFWKEIDQDMKSLNTIYTKKALFNSIYKLVKNNLLIKISKAEYSINKILIFSGPFQNRPKAIQSQYSQSIL